MKVPEKHRAVAHAWVDGARIECGSAGLWHLVPKGKTLHWSEELEYRVKPTPDSIDWSHVAEKYVATVTFPSGHTMCATQVPEETASGWRFGGDYDCVSACNFASFKRGTTEWQDSLVLRPTEETK